MISQSQSHHLLLTQSSSFSFVFLPKPIAKPTHSLSFNSLSSMFPSLSLRPPSPTTTAVSVSVSDNNPLLSSDPFPPLRIAIIGFGNYGQFLAETLIAQGHILFAHSRSDQSSAARRLGVSYFPDLHDLCERHPNVVLLCTSILSIENVLKTLPFQRLRRSTLFVDVLSVKEFAKTLLLQYLPEGFDILCTHPMFGPQSVNSNHGWGGLRFVYDKVRIGEDDELRVSRCESFLGVFEREGCKMVEMSCADHDKFAAESQFITHTLGRVLGMLSLQSTPINTKGYEALLDLTENTCGDSFDLYYGLFVYNNNSLEMLERIDLAFEALRKELFSRLHGVVRKQSFEGEGETNKVHVFPNGYETDASLDSMRSEDVSLKYEYNPQLSGIVNDGSRLKIGIVGFGNFGQFLAKTMVKQGHTVLAYSRTNYTDEAAKLGVSYFSDLDDLFEEHPEVILLCTSILSTEKVLKSLPFQRLKRSTLFGYETLLKLVENTAGDSFDLYYGLFLYNPNAMEQLERFHLAFESLKKQLFGRLHSQHSHELAISPSLELTKL
ncbi:PREDICTED: arogenate dehydrogenase 1, chloroplastic-like [Camelina sativa]|uniref:Arogenate dehydrogenase 1, chloroplastic-like n=1 Tax=Camelina sativa TaxID=90675 RepID=A0ABM0USF2_CAMSA|nr:PREDICTED: arogenate dehydrogenase 1, chloroplastic-like [Camelina sativa]